MTPDTKLSDLVASGLLLVLDGIELPIYLRLVERTHVERTKRVTAKNRELHPGDARSCVRALRRLAELKLVKLHRGSGPHRQIEVL